MSISDKARGRSKENLSSDDVKELLDRINKGGPSSFKPARTLVEAAENYPEVVAQHHDRLASVLGSPLPSMVRRQLYDVALETDIKSTSSLKKIINSAETELIEADGNTRLLIYRLYETAARAGVSIEPDQLDALVRGVADSPVDTPATAAMDAYVTIVTQRDSVGDKELAPLVDFIESDFPEIRSAAFDALLDIINTSDIRSDISKDGFRIVIENYENSGIDCERTAAALEELK